jgi:hypothetical protein
MRLTRAKLEEAPSDAGLTRLFAIFSNVTFFVENYKGRIRSAISSFSATSPTPESIQNVGQELATLLGTVLEAKILVNESVRRLSELP